LKLRNLGSLQKIKFNFFLSTSGSEKKKIPIFDEEYRFSIHFYAGLFVDDELESSISANGSYYFDPKISLARPMKSKLNPIGGNVYYGGNPKNLKGFKTDSGKLFGWIKDGQLIKGALHDHLLLIQ
jgi:hypothetical protein